MAGPRRVLVTGSTGNLGRKAMAALADEPGIEAWGIDRCAPEVPLRAERFVAADLEHFDRAWSHAFDGMTCVLHLAADPKPVGGWESILRLNIDLSLNVLRAAEDAKVDRVVFASSNWVFGGYRFTQDRLDSALPPRPVNPYGASKLLIERCGRAWADRLGSTFLALRIGYCQPGENRPGPHMAFGRWGQEMWLGNRDWAQAVVQAVSAPSSGFVALNIVSRNAGMRWDLEDARTVIGFVPSEAHMPLQDPGNWIRDRAAQAREAWLPSGRSTPVFGARW